MQGANGSVANADRLPPRSLTNLSVKVEAFPVDVVDMRIPLYPSAHPAVMHRFVPFVPFVLIKDYFYHYFLRTQHPINLAPVMHTCMFHMNKILLVDTTVDMVPCLLLSAEQPA